MGCSVPGNENKSGFDLVKAKKEIEPPITDKISGREEND